MSKQECIPVGCVPPAAVAVHGGVCLRACWDTHTHTPSGCGPGDPPQVWAWRPPRCGPGDPPGCGPVDPPWPDPSTSPGSGSREGVLPQCMLGYTHPLGVGVETPWVWAWRPPPRCGRGDPQPPTRCRNTTFANFVCGR